MHSHFKNIIQILLYATIMVGVLLTACGPTTAPTAEIAIGSPEPTSTLEPTFTPSPSSTDTPAPTLTPIPLTNLADRILDQETGQSIVEAEVNSGTITATADPQIGSDLVHQMGFSDEQVLLAGSLGFKLEAVRSIMVNGQPYVAFYLLRDYDPRVISDLATTILIYEGEAETIGNFVYRIEIREPVELEQISALPTPTGFSTSLSFRTKVLTAYEAAGFSLRATRSSTDPQGSEYFAVVLHLNNLYYTLTFEQVAGSPQYDLLETFTFPELPLPGVPFGEYDRNFTFEEAWAAAQADFIPETSIEKALYALGCDFSRGKNNTFMTPGKFGDEQWFGGKRYLLYSCTLLTDYDPSPMEMDFQANNFVAVFEFEGQQHKRLWNSLYLDTSTLTSWGDITGDQIPDLLINKEIASTGSGATYRLGFEAGQDLFQFTDSGDLVDLFISVDGTKLDIQAGYSVDFTDLDGDGIAEILANSIFYGLYGGYRIESMYTIAPTEIYKLQDNSHYVAAETGFEFLCQRAIDRLIESNSDGYDILDYGFRAHTTLVICDTVGVRQDGGKAIKSESEKFVAKMKNYPEACRSWLLAVYQDLALKSSSGEDLLLYYYTDNEVEWDTLFSEAYEQNCRN